MSVYVMAFIKLQKPSWTPLGQEVVDLVHEHGGRYLVRDTAPRQIEGSGEPPDEAVLVEFPSVEKAEAYYNNHPFFAHTTTTFLSPAQPPTLKQPLHCYKHNINTYTTTKFSNSHCTATTTQLI